MMVFFYLYVDANAEAVQADQFMRVSSDAI